MATPNKTIEARIQLKTDTEDNWDLLGPKANSPGFVPLLGELIIYQPDGSHTYSRLKVGNGSTNVVNLPFIDAATINGLHVEIVKEYGTNRFPVEGSSEKLYVDTSTDKIYHYMPNKGYCELSQLSISSASTTATRITEWSAGTMTNLSIRNHRLVIANGTAPQLSKTDISVLSSITEGGA